MWILILAMYTTSPYTDATFRSLHTQEFDTATSLSTGHQQFVETF